MGRSGEKRVEEENPTSQGEAKCKLIKNFPPSRQRPGEKNSPKPKPISLPSAWDPFPLMSALLWLTWQAWWSPEPKTHSRSRASFAIYSPSYILCPGFPSRSYKRIDSYVLITHPICEMLYDLGSAIYNNKLWFSQQTKATVAFNRALQFSIGSLPEELFVCGIREGWKIPTLFKSQWYVLKLLQIVRNFLIIFRISVWVELISQLRFNWDSKGEE